MMERSRDGARAENPPEPIRSPEDRDGRSSPPVPAEGAWLEIQIYMLMPEAAEVVADLCIEAGARGVEFRDLAALLFSRPMVSRIPGGHGGPAPGMPMGTGSSLDGPRAGDAPETWEGAVSGGQTEFPREIGAGAGPAPGGHMVIAHLPAGAEARQAVDKLQRRLLHLEEYFGRPVVEDVAVRRVADEDWYEGWKTHYKPISVGESLTIIPTWMKDGEPAAPGRTPIYLDPGMAFGTGEHVTTRQALELLEQEMKGREGPSVLDVGTGSGILSIAAALLGAGPVLGLDIDPIAVEVAAENAAYNGVEGDITFRCGDLAQLSAEELARWFGGEMRADIVISNILLPVLTALAGPLTDSLKAGGSLILAGVVADGGDELVRVFTGRGLTLARWRRDEGWYAAVFEKTPEDP